MWEREGCEDRLGRVDVKAKAGRDGEDIAMRVGGGVLGVEGSGAAGVRL